MDLSLVSTHDLLNEITKRYDHIVISGLQLGYEASGLDYKTRRWKGQPEICVGLAQRMASVVHEQADSEEDEINGQ